MAKKLKGFEVFVLTRYGVFKWKAFQDGWEAKQWAEGQAQLMTAREYDPTVLLRNLDKNSWYQIAASGDMIHYEQVPDGFAE